jgi:hypothetical protein
MGNGVGLDAAPVRDYWRRVGFVRHAPEYWLLTRCVVDRMGRGCGEGGGGGLLPGNGGGDGDATGDGQGVLVKREEGDMGAFHMYIIVKACTLKECFDRCRIPISRCFSPTMKESTLLRSLS